MLEAVRRHEPRLPRAPLTDRQALREALAVDVQERQLPVRQLAGLLRLEHPLAVVAHVLEGHATDHEGEAGWLLAHGRDLGLGRLVRPVGGHNDGGA